MAYRFIFVFILFSCLSYSQSETDIDQEAYASQKQISFRNVTVENGLSQNSVVSIAQDRIGYLWFATQDGLNRYDGKTFKYYNKQFVDITRPTYSKLGKVYVDREGAIWTIPLSGTLEKYLPEKDSFVSVPKFKDVSTIYQDRALNYFIGTYGSGLYKIGSKTKDTLQLLKPEDFVNNIYNFKNEEENVLAMSSNGLLSISTDNSYSVINYGTKIQNFSSAAQTQNNNIWLGTFGGGLFLKADTSDTLKPFTGFNDSAKLPDNLVIQSLLVDRHDRLWVATYGDGAYLLDFKNQSVKHFLAQKTNPYALHYNDVLSLYEDFTGTIWLGTDGAGLSYYDENLSKFNVLTNNQTPKDINVDVVRAISVGNDKTIWLGTSGKGLTSYNTITEAYKTWTTSNSNIKSNRVMSLLHSDDNLWIGFQGEGLNILSKNGQFKDFRALKNYTIWKIVKDAENRFWLCTRSNGLIQFDINDGIIQRFNSNNTGLSTNNIRTIEVDDDQNLWIGTEDKGLHKLNIETSDSHKIDMVAENIKSLYKDPTGILWIGTNGKGLKAYDPLSNSVVIYDRDNGLPNNVIYSILPGNIEGDLWLSSNRGITRFRPDNETALDITNYNNYDGLQALEFNTGAYFKDEDGYLYFGGLEGVNWFRPEQLTKNPIAPKTVITGLQVFTQDHKIIPDAKFKHNQNTLNFSFAGLHFSLPERNNYQYQLLNYDQDWIMSGNNNTAHYSKLKPDSYTFMVKSSNYDNVWDEQAASFSFTILQPWYFNTWTKLLYALLMALSAFAIYKYLKWRWHMKMQLQFEHNETERLKKLDEFKTKLYTNISHEFRTPLTLISGPIEKQLSKPDLSTEDKTEFSLIQRNSKRLLNLVNQLLDLSKLESGSLKLNVTEGDLGILLKQIASVFEFRANEKQIEFSTKITSINNAWFDKDVVEKIVTNLLSNAIKYAPENGTVDFETAVRDGQIILTVINNGNTITDDELSKLFQRFYQTDKSSDGAGIGLSLVKELCILSHGNVVAHTMNDDEIQFTVTLPIERSYFNQAEIEFKDQIDTEELPENDFEVTETQAVELASDDLPVLLIIEDDDDVRQFIASIFKDAHVIIEAIDGKEGIEKAIKSIPDLIISDIMMPIADGIEVCNTLKYDERTSHIPIILLTAKVDDKDEIIGLKTGADDYITKPFNAKKLKIRVENLIQIRRQLRKRYSNEFEIAAKDIAITSVDEQFIKRMQDVLDRHITDPDFSSEVFGEKMNMSRMQLHRKLKALTGLSSSEFLRSQRLKIALKLLKESDYTVSEIAYEVGFNTPSYFTKCFKEAFNCTPNEYLLNA